MYSDSKYEVRQIHVYKFLFKIIRTKQFICKNLDLPRVKSNNTEVIAVKDFMKRKSENGENLFKKEIILKFLKVRLTLTKSDKLFVASVIKLAMEGKTVQKKIWKI